MKSSLYRELAAEELSGIVDAALHTPVQSARLLTGGLFNTTYLAETRDSGRVVVRVGPVNRHLLMPFEHHLMAAEAQVYALCAARQIPVSQVLAVDTSRKLIDRDFMIVRHIPSRPMNEAILAQDDKDRICRDIGEAVARLHQITSQRFGRIADVASGGGFARWSECLQNELRQWEQVAMPTGLFSETEHLQIRSILAAGTPLLDEIRIPRLVHVDLWEGNLLISEAAPRPEFAAIIDADRALWGDSDLEFASIRWMYPYDEFWKGYGRRLPQDRPGLIRRDLYHLLYCLWDSYVYLQEYNQPEQAKAQHAVAQKLIAGLLQSEQGL